MGYLGRDSFCLWGAAGSCGCSSEPSVRYRLCQAYLNPLQSQNHSVTQPHVPCAQGSHHQGGLVLLLLQEHPCPRNLAQSSWCWAQAPGHLMNMSTTVNALFCPKTPGKHRSPQKDNSMGWERPVLGWDRWKGGLKHPGDVTAPARSPQLCQLSTGEAMTPWATSPTLNNIYMGNQPWAPQTAWLALVQTLLLFNTK